MLFSYSAPYAFAAEAFLPKKYPRLLFHRWHLDDDPIKASCRCYDISGDNRTSVTGSKMYRWTKVSNFPNINGRLRFWVGKMVDVPLWYFLACAISFWNPRTVLSLILFELSYCSSGSIFTGVLSNKKSVLVGVLFTLPPSVGFTIALNAFFYLVEDYLAQASCALK